MPFRKIKGRTAPLRARLQIQTAIRMIYWRRGTSSPCSGSKFSVFFPASPHVSPCSVSGRSRS